MLYALLRTAFSLGVFAFIPAAGAGLVAHWPLDTNAEDVVGGYHGFASGGVIFGAEGAAFHSGAAAEFLSLIHISEPTRPERIGVSGVCV